MCSDLTLSVNGIVGLCMCGFILSFVFLCVVSSISVTTLSTVENEVNFSWPVPDRTCCDQFRVMLSNVTVATTNQTEYRFSNLDFDVEVYASVRCVSENVFEGIPSEPRAILNS